ncbi:MAG: universal stress protein [Pseudomonadales bacterium]|nr:universal stress protein [Pseudomonadales bacterium]
MVAKVLIAIDLSDSSDAVLKAGKGLADTYGAHCEVIHCMEPYPSHFGDLALPQLMPDLLEIKSQLLPHFEQLTAEHGINKEHISIEFSHAGEAIIDKANKESFDLIVLGSHGRHGARLLLGSTCNNVLHHAHCDVLAVRIKD